MEKRVRAQVSGLSLVSESSLPSHPEEMIRANHEPCSSPPKCARLCVVPVGMQTT